MSLLLQWKVYVWRYLKMEDWHKKNILYQIEKIDKGLSYSRSLLEDLKEDLLGED